MTKRTLLIFSVFFLLIAAFNGCKKDGPENNPGPEDLVLAPGKQQFQAGEIVILLANQHIREERYSGKIGETTVYFGRTGNDSGLAFILPVENEGAYNIEIEGLEHNSITIHVAPAIQISDPKIIFDEFDKSLGQNIQSIKDAEGMGYKVDAKQLSNIEKLRSEFSQRVNSLNEEEKLKLAHFLKANNIGQYRYQPEELTDSFYLNKTGHIKDPGKEFNKMSALFLASLTSTLLAKDALIAVIRMGPPSPWKLAGVACMSVSTGVGVLVTKLTAERLGKLAGIADEFSEDLRKNTITFNNDESVKINPRINFRTIIREDQNHEFTLVSTVVKSLLKFEKAWKQVKNGLETVQGWLNISLEPMEDSPLNIDDKPDSKIFAADPEAIKFGNITNNVQVSKNIIEDELYVTVKSDVTTDFSFDVIYSRPELGITLRKKFYARVEAEEAGFSIIGEWEALEFEYLPLGTEFEEEKHQFCPDLITSSFRREMQKMFFGNKKVNFQARDVLTSYEYISLDHSNCTHQGVNKNEKVDNTNTEWEYTIQGNKLIVSLDGEVVEITLEVVDDNTIKVDGQVHKRK